MRPVERKVYAGTIGAGAGLTISNFALWVAEQVWWPADNVEIPLPVAGVIELLVTTGCAFLFGWLAKHDPGYVMIDGGSDVEPMPNNPEFEHERRLL